MEKIAIEKKIQSLDLYEHASAQSSYQSSFNRHTNKIYFLFTKTGILISVKKVYSHLDVSTKQFWVQNIITNARL